MNDILKSYEEKFGSLPTMVILTAEQTEWVKVQIIRAVNGKRGKITDEEIIERFKDDDFDKSKSLL